MKHKALFIHYPKCGTCRKAAAWLKANQIDFQARDIVEQRPSVDELQGWIPQSNLNIRKFFNTSGVLYREMNLKDRLKYATDQQMIDLLATDGKLVKRPLLIVGSHVLVGFNEEQWAQELDVEILQS